MPQSRSQKRALHRSKEDRITAEVDDLVMFERIPTIFEQDDSTRRYALRSTRKQANAHRSIDTTEELSGESSSDEEHREGPTQPFAPRKTRDPAKTRGNGKRSRRTSPRESSTEDEGDDVLT